VAGRERREDGAELVDEGSDGLRVLVERDDDAQLQRSALLGLCPRRHDMIGRSSGQRDYTSLDVSPHPATGIAFEAIAAVPASAGYLLRMS
jgi:hypothetical protein